MQASAPGTSWGQPGAEEAVIRLAVDGVYSQHVILFCGAAEHDYRRLLGPLAAGPHRLEARLDTKLSSPGARSFNATFRVRSYGPDDPEYEAIRRAPFVWARADTLGKATDTPLLAYYEWLSAEGDRPPTASPPPPGTARLLQYTYIFSNEDAGTNTPALLARWGRTADIEHVYRRFLDAAGQPLAESFQAVNHKETAFGGKRIGEHPLYGVASRNNNFSDQQTSPVRYALWPEQMDLSQHSREQALDEHPWAYRIMAEEMEREGKITDEVSDSRQYLIIEARFVNKATGATFGVRLKDGREFRADASRADRRIERDGWGRSAVRLPAGTAVTDVATLRFYCGEPAKPPPNPPADRACTLEAVSKAFMLDAGYRPGPPLSFTGPLPIRLKPGAESDELRMKN
jgi:hypothetical protein